MKYKDGTIYIPGLKGRKLNPEPLDNLNTISIPINIETYDKPIISIVCDEIVAKLGKVKIGGAK